MCKVFLFGDWTVFDRNLTLLELAGTQRMTSAVTRALTNRRLAPCRSQVAERFPGSSIRCTNRKKIPGDTFAIDLASRANHPMNTALTDKDDDYCFELMPRGWVDLEGIPFQVADDLVLMDSFSEEENSSVGGIVVDAAVARFHFLHNMVAVPLGQGVVPVRYEIQYADGTQADFEVTAWKHISKCSANHRIGASSHALVAWAGQTSNHDRINVVRTTWTNPHPNKKIAEIQIVLADDVPCKFVCLAITGERAQP